MTNRTIAIMMPGDMGHAVGRVLREHGHDVFTCLQGRGEHSHTLSRSAGLREVDTWADVVDQADMILSILPPAAAIDLASGIAALMQELGKTPLYVDCNAVSPDTAQKVAAIITAAGAPVYRYRHHWYGTRQSCQQRGAAFLCFRSRTERHAGFGWPGHPCD